MEPRLERHGRVSAWLAARTDDELAAILRAAPAGPVGVGGDAAVLDVGGARVFAKRIPLTDRERARPDDPANLFDLPTSCHYGMYRLASPSVSAWRELAANQVVTDGVLAGEAAGFALLHHARVLPGRAPIAAEHQDVDAVVAQFGGAPAVRHRLEALAAATSSLVLFLEHVADPLVDRLHRIEPATLERRLFEHVAFLRRHELLHLDGHFGNLRADDDRVYLVDFGLATSPRFARSDAERAFVARNVTHDADYAAMRLVRWLTTTVPSPPGAAAIVARHAAAAARMSAFCARLHAGELDADYGSPTT